MGEATGPSVDAVTPEECKALGERLGALACATRLGMLAMIMNEPDGITSKELVGRTGLAQPTIAGHVRRLVEAGLVRKVPDSLWKKLYTDDDGFASLHAQLLAVLNLD